MLSWLRRLLGASGQGPAEPGNLESGHNVAFDDAGIRVREPGGSEHHMRWDDLASVVILTNDQGPFAVDVHWVLAARDQGLRLVLPMGSAGEQELLREMQQRLPGFDNAAVIDAMGSTDNASFLVWQAAA
jgi:hypothetical protein